MSALAPGRWEQLSPYLDQALTLTDPERAEWLAALREKDPALADELQGLLEEHRAVVGERFLEQGPLAVPAQAKAGQRIGAYTLVSPIGEGGMGSIWLAERSDGRFERRAAVKFLRLTLVGRGGEERFKREGSILGRVAHPHIAELLDAGLSADGQPYLILEHVEGQHIDRYCDAQRLGVEARLSLFLDVLDAVAHAHANLIVHRDLKPSNVLVRNDGQVKLLDFGIAKLLEEENEAAAATQLTLQGGGALTPAYAAPEQITSKPVTTATDVYALGVLLYLLLSGQHPAGAGSLSTAQMVKAIVDVEPARLSDAVIWDRVEAEVRDANAARRGTTPEKLRRSLRGDLDTIVAKTLKKDPQERYRSVTALADDLRRYLRSESISARPDTFAYRVGKFVRRNRAATALAAVAVVATLGGVTGTLLQAHTARVQRDEAYRERDRANRVAEFMTGMFKAADPMETAGAEVSARAVLDKASKDITTGLSKDPRLQAQMMQVMGNAYTSLGDYARSEQLLRQAIEIGRASRGPEDPVTLASMDYLGYVLVERGLGDEGEKLQRQALEIQQRVLGPEHPDTLQTMGDLAGTLSLEGKFAEAEKLGRVVLEKERRVFGPEDHHTISAMDNLAATLGEQGRYAESERLERETIELESRVYGTEYMGTLMSMSNQVDTLYFLGRYREAKQMLEQVLATQRRVIGAHHPETARSIYNLGCLAAREGKRDQAFSLLGQAIDDLSPRNIPKLDNDPTLKPLQGDPRFAKLAARAKARGATDAMCPL
jgi:eukaryotic-like serine/threonine-protein kinase